MAQYVLWEFDHWSGPRFALGSQRSQNTRYVRTNVQIFSGCGTWVILKMAQCTYVQGGPDFQLHFRKLSIIPILFIRSGSNFLGLLSGWISILEKYRELINSHGHGGRGADVAPVGGLVHQAGAASEAPKHKFPCNGWNQLGSSFHTHSLVSF